MILTTMGAWLRRKLLKSLRNRTNKAGQADFTKKYQAYASTPKNGEAYDQLARQHQQQLAIYEEEANRLSQMAITDALHSSAEKDIAENFTQDQIEAHYQIANQQIKDQTEATHIHLQQQVTEQKAQLDNGSVENQLDTQIARAKRQAYRKADRSVSLPPLNIGLRWAMLRLGDVHSVVALLEERLKQTQEEKLQSDTRYQNLLQRYGRMTPTRKLLDYDFVFFCAVCLLFFIEIGANFSAFQDINLGSNNLIALGLGIFFALVQALAAKELGFAWRYGHKARRNLLIGITLILCLLVGGTRWYTDEPLLVKFIYVFINLLLAAVTAYIAWIRAKHRSFFKERRLQRRLAMRITRLNDTIQRISEHHQQSYTEIEEDFARRKEGEYVKAKEEIQQQIVQLEAEQEKLAILTTQSLSRLGQIKESALGKYRQIYSETQRNRNLSRPEARRRSSSTLKDLPNEGFKRAGMLLLLCFALLGCHDSVVSPPTHIEVLYDRTDATDTMDIDAMADYILSYISETDEDQYRGEVNIVLSSIGEISSQSSEVITLAEESSFWLRNESQHQESWTDFGQQLRQSLRRLTESGEGLDHSYIHRNFYYRLKAMPTDTSMRRIVLSWSDLIVNSPEANFYRYKHQPDRLLADKEKVIEAMTADYPLPVLKGVSLINVYLPGKEEDALHEAAKRLFDLYWQDLGIKTRFLTNIPGNRTGKNVSLSSM